MRTTIKTIALAATVTAMTFGATVHAQEAPRAEIGLYGYDLTNPVAVKHLKDRIKSAARSVCGLHETDALADRNAKMSCYRSAVQIASAKVDARVALVTTQKQQLSSR